MIRTVLKIDGMMCGMCEAHINDVIRKTIADAKKVKSSHTKGECSFISEQEPDFAKLEAAIAENGYKMESFQTEPYKKKFLGLF
ncbi:MAG: heavy-metal-associated domain-containing protein [Agathobacter sp.]|uniref:heavy-metal-associated domain-containing protein n=1 Tax=Agathobacter sp. TaxID=2021311 RepID=UPI002585DECB|nr:heavy metal-associated domain-containing protein [Agathobacter sp.]MCR5676980.1 heavy-metal-associated domain-containing protein [Agathobacter sp.]